MRMRWGAVLACALAASVLAVPARAVQWIEERAYIPTKYGDMFVDFVRPSSGRAPVILTMTPYRYDRGDVDPGRNRTDIWRDRYTKQGYARAYADIVGTGLSEGCWDYGGKAEAETGAAVVEWLGTRSWSTGKVGMIGVSYDAAIQIEIATLAPNHLAAIVPQEPVSSWYDYSYDHGVAMNMTDEESGDVPWGTPDTFDVFGAVTPNIDPDHASAAALEREARDRASGCDAVEHNTRGHLVQPEFGPFWAERDWASRAHKIKAAVLIQHGWRDMNTKPNQFTRFWDNLRNAADKRALLGQWPHRNIFSSGGAEYVALPWHPQHILDAFFARWLKGHKNTLLLRVPPVLTQANDGRLRTHLPVVTRRTSYALTKPLSGDGTFVNTGTESSKVFKTDLKSGRGFAAYAFPVRSRTRLVGSGTVTLRLRSSLPRGQVAVTLLDDPGDGTVPTVVTLGLLDLRFRDSLSTPKDVPLDTPFTARVTLRPQDHVVQAGHRLVVAVAGSDVVWGIPDPLAGQQLAVLKGSVAQLPLTGAGGEIA